MSRVVDYCGRSCLDFPVRVLIDSGSEGSKLFVKFVFKILHGLGEVPFGDEWVGVGHIVHGLHFVHYNLSYGCLGKSDCRIVGVRPINTTPMWYEINLLPKYDG